MTSEQTENYVDCINAIVYVWKIRTQHVCTTPGIVDVSNVLCTAAPSRL